MRLKTSVGITTKPGTTRTYSAFAWLPTLISGNYVWLEFYEVLEGYIQYPYTVTVNEKIVIANVYKWIQLSKRLRT